MGKPRPNTNETPQSEYQRVRLLMKEIGSSSGFDPIPPDQHAWMLDPTQPPLQRMWAWMLAHTIHWGHRTAYATDKRSDGRQPGRELHMEHIAADLKDVDGREMDLANAYRVWRRGVERGIWRDGTAEEGPRRLYLTGKVPKFSSTGKEIVCTDNFPRSIQNQINNLDWPVEKQLQFRERWGLENELQGHVQAALIAANRSVFTERQDNILTEFGLEPIHQEHTKKHETPADAEARRKRIEPIRSHLHNYVQTIREYVQTAPNPPRETTASLLPAERNTREEVARSVGPLPRSRNGKPPRYDGEKPINQLPAPRPAPIFTQSEHKAANLIYSEIEQMQGYEGFKHMDFTRERISKTRKSDQLFVSRVLMAVGPENVEQFLQRVWMQLKNLNKNALGKLPGRAPAPRSLGLILTWAVEYGENITEAARMEAEEKQRWMERCIANCHETMNDPEETAEAKFEARKWLETNALKDAQTA